MEALAERHRPVPIYIGRTGRWQAGHELREIAAYQREDGPRAPEVSLDLASGALVPAAGGSLLRGVRRPQPIELDLVVLATHGTQGEDGCLAGALELAGLPYVGPGVGAAAMAMDKVATKAVLAAAGLPVVEHLALRREAFERDRAGIAAAIVERFPMPVYVKPANLGSSVGVSRCEREAELQDALELCFELDRVCIVEGAVEGGGEVNCAVIGRPGTAPRASVCEQPIPGERFLSFEDKYMSGGKGDGKQQAPGAEGPGHDRDAAASKSGEAAKGPGMQSARRLIPAPIGQEQTRRVQELACASFEAFGCAGVTRVDFLTDADGGIYVNELNTIPGSFSFYLWEPAGLPFADLMDELIEIALAEHAEKARTTTVFASNLLAQRAGGGAKA